MMGTYVTILIYHTDEDEAKEIIEDTFSRMEEIVNIADRYSSSSELSRLNTNGTMDNPSPELLEMIRISIEYWDITHGAFDITILPLIDLWIPSSGAGPFQVFTMDQSFADDLNAGSVSEDIRDIFRTHNYNLSENATLVVDNVDQEWTIKSWDEAPDWVYYTITNSSGELTVDTQFFWKVDYNKQDEYINQTMQFIGSEKITMTDSSLSIEPGMSLTLDGVAKGYVVDAGITFLKEQGVERALVEAGGDIGTLGHKPKGEKWVIGLRDPQGKNDSIMEFGVSGRAVATSGNYERFYDENKDVGHILDPKTGRSVLLASSATVIADNCTVADILATGIFVLGPEEGIQLVETLPDVEALMLGYEDPTELSASSGIDEYEIPAWALERLKIIRD